MPTRNRGNICPLIWRVFYSQNLFTDAEELKAINKQINALQEELGRLREEMKNTRAFLKDIEREYVCCVAGEE